MESVLSLFPRLPPVQVPSKRQKESRASIIRESFKVDRVPIQTGNLTRVSRGNGDLESVLSPFPRLPPVQVPSKKQNEYRASVIRKSFRSNRVHFQTGNLTGGNGGNGDLKSVFSLFPRLPPVQVPSKRQKEYRASIIRKSFRGDRVPNQTESLTGVSRGNGDLKSVLSPFPRLPPVHAPRNKRGEYCASIIRESFSVDRVHYW